MEDTSIQMIQDVPILLLPYNAISRSLGMGSPKIDNTVSIGSILNMVGLGITIIGLIVGITMSWSQMDSQMASEKTFREEAVKQITQTINSAAQSRDKLEARIRILEEMTARSDERFSMLLSMMSEMKIDISKIAERIPDK